MKTAEELDELFSIEGEVGFMEMDGDLIFMSVTNKFSDADICLHGAHVTHFQPHDSIEVLWMSPDSDFEVGKPIRGGIPVCFPWFGPNPSDASLPAHGFARLMYWDVVKAASMPTGETFIQLQLCATEETRKFWPFNFCATMEFTVGRNLEVRLKIENTDSQAFTYSSALHTYFLASEIENMSITGLQGTQYYQGFAMDLHTQTEEKIIFRNEENRRYIGTSADCFINDSAFRRTLKASKEGSNVTVVWNPWAETAAKMADMPDDAYQSFLCVESVNAYPEYSIELKPGEKHVTAAIIGIEE